MPSSIELIVARATNGVIGANGAMPWHIPEDLRHFRRTTMGCPVVMGRKTWASIGRALPGRRNVVITRQAGFEAPGAEVAGSVEAALALLADAPRVFVFGGGEVYRQTIGRADVLWVTEIEAAPEGDARFPDFDKSAWTATLLEALPAAEGRPAVRFMRYDKPAA